MGQWRQAVFEWSGAALLVARLVALVVALVSAPLVAFTAAPAAHAGLPPTEELHYRVTYRGVFSLGRDLAIADATLRQAVPTTAQGLREIRLQASSANYPFVESMYPMRYRFRSWRLAGAPELVAFESYQEASRKRHRLYLRDDSDPGYRRIDIGPDEGPRELAMLDAGIDPSRAEPRRRLFDRLELLQRVRSGRLDAHTENRYPVTNGRREMLYRVRVEGAETVDVGGVGVSAWKVRFDGFDRDADGRLELAHRPLYFWFDQRPGHLPLRAESRHTIGIFRVELDARRSAPALAGMP